MHREQVISGLSVNHAGTLDHFRAACEISDRVSAGTASTEDMRQAMIHFRVLFTELLGRAAPADSETVPGTTTSRQDNPAGAAPRGRDS